MLRALSDRLIIVLPAFMASVDCPEFIPAIFCHMPHRTHGLLPAVSQPHRKGNFVAARKSDPL
ncbi:hypothetical protein [Tatumella ptyseos]|uniref:Uncharacterized protein n=1 Tax=Tatumella ptyseos ATCC 33301 TaxID=1005995 RepID=A0A085JF29_9GAMM|nr:hypothetical protein [Tatumella ptyseos]KFD19075.1 hypothetical protein GTPT_2013 [Tatumella ptyseos ATCC 33301]